MIMLHILIACASIICSILGLATASRRVVFTSHALIAATVASGSVLMLTAPVNMLRVCVSGLTYIALASVLTYLAHRRVRRLATQTNQ